MDWPARHGARPCRANGGHGVSGYVWFEIEPWSRMQYWLRDLLVQSCELCTPHKAGHVATVLCTTLRLEALRYAATRFLRSPPRQTFIRFRPCEQESATITISARTSEHTFLGARFPTPHSAPLTNASVALVFRSNLHGAFRYRRMVHEHLRHVSCVVDRRSSKRVHGFDVAVRDAW